MKIWKGYAIFDNLTDFNTYACYDEHFHLYRLEGIVFDIKIEDISFPLCLKCCDTPCGYQWEITTQQIVVCEWEQEWKKIENFYKNLIKDIDKHYKM